MARDATFSINAHHARIVKIFSYNLICTKIILHEDYFYENLLYEKKANYGSLFIQCSVKHIRQSQNTSMQVPLYSTVLILKMNVAILEHSSDIEMNVAILEHISDIENECGHTRAQF